MLRIFIILLMLAMSLLILAMSQISMAEFKLFDVDQIFIDAEKIEDKRDPYIPDEAFTYGGSFNLNLRAFHFLRWENRLHLAGTNSQVREAGWQFRVAIPLFTPDLEAYYGHHSRHVLERANPSREFPLDNVIGLRIYFKR